MSGVLKTSDVPEARCVCGYKFECATPMPGTPRDSVPEPGSLTLCLRCARCYQFGPGLELVGPVVVHTLPGISTEQVAEIHTLQRRMLELQGRAQS